MAFNKRTAVLGIAAVLWLSVAVPAALAGRIRIVATVNDEVISSHDLEQRRTLLMRTSGIPETPDNIARITPQILDGLLTERLQMQEAKRQSITITPEEVARALDSMQAAKEGAPGSLKKSLIEQGLSPETLEQQARAQLAWGKVVQRKLRRNVSIAQDEIIRAQKELAASPGMPEVKLAALKVGFPANITATEAKATVEAVQQQIAQGVPLAALAASAPEARRAMLQFSPPTWVAEEGLSPELVSALKQLAKDAVTPPLRMPGGAQFLQVLERRMTKPPAANTEFVYKQVALSYPAKPSEVMMTKLATSERVLRRDAGSCDDATVPMIPLSPEVSFARNRFSQLPPELRGVLARLEVGQVSAPVMAPGNARFILLCERVEASAGNAPGTDEIRQRLFAEKMDLEAQKLLRNLRRDATIDIRTEE